MTIEIPKTYLLALMLALQLGDWWTTRTILKIGGRELNPVIRVLMDFLGVDQALAIKGILVVWLCVTMTDADWLLGLVAIYVAVVVNNLLVMKKLQTKK